MFIGPLESVQDYQNRNRELRQQTRDILRNQQQPPIAMTIFISDLFEGETNPGETFNLKLFTISTAERRKDDKLTIAHNKVKDVMVTFC